MDQKYLKYSPLGVYVPLRDYKYKYFDLKGGLPNRCRKKSKNDELLDKLKGIVDSNDQTIKIHAIKATDIGFYNHEIQDIIKNYYYNGLLIYEDIKYTTVTLSFQILTYEKNSKIIKCISNNDKYYIFNFNEIIKATLYLIK